MGSCIYLFKIKEYAIAARNTNGQPWIHAYIGFNDVNPVGLVKAIERK
jgi:hypothetical protein